MEKDYYEEMADMLSSVGFRIGPGLKSPELMELLHFWFTPEEVRIAVLAGFEGCQRDALAKRTEIPPETLKAKLKNMSEKGLIWIQPGSENPVYKALTMEAPGLYETAVWRKDDSPFKKKLQELLYKVVPIYINEGVTLEGAIDLPVCCAPRVLPPNTPAAENMFEQIKQQADIAVALCPCRSLADVCSHPVESCFSFGEIARWAIEHNFARRITADECISMLEEFEDLGMFHVGMPGFAVCSCCKDACINLIGMRMGKRHVISKGTYFAFFDSELCNSCGACVERCPVEIIELEPTATADPEKCTGCGICAVGCPEIAVKMVRRTDEEIAGLQGKLMEKMSNITYLKLF